jgi:hypothetical protein
VATASIESSFAFAAQVAALIPESLDKIDGDAMVEEHFVAKGAPAKVIRTDDKVAEIRAERAEQVRQQQMMEQAAASAQMAKTLGDTSTQEGNALSVMAGNI